MRYLLTPSLYNSWRWYHEAEDTPAARRDLITTLRREQIAPNEAMLKGRQFEADIQATAEGEPPLPLDDPLYEGAVAAIAEIVLGGLFQERIYHDMHFRGHGDFLLYGKIDVLRRDWIYDIKWSASRYEIGKYYKSIQHTAYMAGSGCRKFAYLISDGRSLFREDYHFSDEMYAEMRCRLSNMLDDIARDKELSALYQTHWKAEPRK